MSEWLAGALTTIAFCWRLDRRDGIALGFTSHDHDLGIGGMSYRAAPGMLPSAVSLSDGFGVDTLDIAGALTDAAIRADDLAAGRWDAARVRLFAVDWTDPETSRIDLMTGELGEVGQRDNAFTAELRGATALLERPVVETVSAECRAELGDRRCRVDLAGRAVHAVIVEVVDDVMLRIDRAEPAANAYGYGRLLWLDGANSGIVQPVRASLWDRIELRLPPPFAVTAGTRIELVEGCDKRFATCRDRFANPLNFRGEPHVPGGDLLARYAPAA